MKESYLYSKEALTAQVESYVKDSKKQLLDDLESLKMTELTLGAMADIVSKVPKKVLRRSKIRFYGHHGYYTVDLHPRYGEFTEHDTMLITQWCAEQDKWSFRKDAYMNGKFSHILEKWSGYNHHKITFNGTSDIDGCELVEVIETREVKTYKIKC